jgi:hypothetical protein
VLGQPPVRADDARRRNESCLEIVQVDRLAEVVIGSGADGLDEVALVGVRS